MVRRKPISYSLAAKLGFYMLLPFNKALGVIESCNTFNILMAEIYVVTGNFRREGRVGGGPKLLVTKSGGVNS